MTKKMVVLAIISLFILGLTAFAADSNFGVGKTRELTVAENTKVGDVVVPAGDYKVQHLMENGDHIMVFKSVDRNKEVARVKCTMQKLDKKSEHTLTMIDTANNQRVMTGIIFAGDDFRHSF